MVIKNQGPSPNPNPLSFSEIEDEFGNNPGRSLGRYRASHPDYQNDGPFSGADNAMLGSGNMPLDDGIPTGNNDPIRFSDFYGKKLNIIIDYYSGNDMNRTGTGGGNDTKQIATRRYINESTGPEPQRRVRVVGGYRTRPSGSVNSSQVLSSPSAQWQGGKKVIVHVNKSVGSEPGPAGKVALRTGQWPTGTELQLDIGDNGRILGAGGNGGNGTGASPAPDGGDGTSALGVEFACHINKRPSGIIRCGYGGGGGGGGGASNPNKSPTDFGRGGGGGGGGAGFPAGTGGSKGPNGFGPGPSPSIPSKGGNGSQLGEGFGGDGGNSSGGAVGGDGGNGGSSDNPTADKGGDGAGGGKGYDPGSGNGGDGGSNGFGIIFRNSTVDNATDGVNDTPGPQGGDSNSQSIL